MIKFLDNLAENVAHKIAALLVKAKVSTLSVTVFRFIVAAPVSWYFFSRGKYWYTVIGLILYMSLALLDWADGEMARLYKLPKETKHFGKLVDSSSDRILMLIVLAAISYAGMNGPNSHLWIIVTVAYFSAFFFSTSLMYEFDEIFSLDIHDYPQLDHKMRQINHKPSISDRILYNLLNVHNNSITRIFFTHNFLLIIGILTNQLLPVFAFFVIMHTVRSAGVFILMYKTLHMHQTDSVLAKVLRKYIRNQ